VTHSSANARYVRTTIGIGEGGLDEKAHRASRSARLRKKGEKNPSEKLV
jgi:hypothetical protein